MVLDAGRFFRAEGGNAEPFGTPQSDSISNHNHPFSFQHTHGYSGNTDTTDISHAHHFSAYTDWTDINHNHGFTAYNDADVGSTEVGGDGGNGEVDHTTWGMNSMGSDALRNGSSHRHSFSGNTDESMSKNNPHRHSYSGTTSSQSVSSGTTGSTGATETRPINVAIRVWKRVS